MSVNIKDLCQLVYIEIRGAIAEVLKNFEHNPGIGLKSIRVRIGEPPSEENPDDIDNYLIPPEYGWMVDMTFDPLADYGTASVNEERIDFTFIGGLFNKCKVDAIQGIGSVWEKRLKDYNISTIEELAKADHFVIAKLCSRYKNHRPVEFQMKAHLAQAEVPVIDQFKSYSQTIYQIGIADMTFLAGQFNPPVPFTMVKQLSDFCRLMITILRDNILQKTKISTLLSADQ